MSTNNDAPLFEQAKPAAAAAAAVQTAAWHAALTVRGFLVAAVLGVVFCIITIKLNLGSAGMTPSLNIAGAQGILWTAHSYRTAALAAAAAAAAAAAVEAARRGSRWTQMQAVVETKLCTHTSCMTMTVCTQALVHSIQLCTSPALPLSQTGGLLAYVLLKAFTQLGAKCSSSSSSTSGPLLPSLPLPACFTPQENAVVQTMTSACYSLAGYSGFGSYLLAMGYQAYLNVGGVPKDQPGYEAGEQHCSNCLVTFSAWAMGYRAMYRSITERGRGVT
jgi:hypothetical protein